MSNELSKIGGKFCVFSYFPTFLVINPFLVIEMAANHQGLCLGLGKETVTGVNHVFIPQFPFRQKPTKTFHRVLKITSGGEYSVVDSSRLNDRLKAKALLHLYPKIPLALSPNFFQNPGFSSVAGSCSFFSSSFCTSNAGTA